MATKRVTSSKVYERRITWSIAIFAITLLLGVIARSHIVGCLAGRGFTWSGFFCSLAPIAIGVALYNYGLYVGTRPTYRYHGVQFTRHDIHFFAKSWQIAAGIFVGLGLFSFLAMFFGPCG